MCSAILMRMVLIGSMRVLAWPRRQRAAGAERRAAAAAARGAAGGAAAARRGAAAAAAPRAAGLLRQVGFHVLLGDAAAGAGAFHAARSILFSRAILRTSGESGPLGSAGAVSSTCAGAGVG